MILKSFSPPPNQPLQEKRRKYLGLEASHTFPFILIYNQEGAKIINIGIWRANIIHEMTEWDFESGGLEQEGHIDNTDSG